MPMSTSSCTAFVPPRVLMVTGACLPEAERRLIDGKFADVIEVVSPRDPEDIFSRAGNVTDYVLGGPEYIDAGFLARMPALRRIALLGTGIPSFIDEAATRKRSIAVFNTPHVNADSVAEFALGIIIVNAADVVASADGVRTGSCWLQTPWRKLQDRRIGIVGRAHRTGTDWPSSCIGARRLSMLAGHVSLRWSGVWCAIHFRARDGC